MSIPSHKKFDEIIAFIRGLYKTNDFIALHEPKFIGNEKKYVNDAIDSTFVSSVGEYVNRFEKMMADYTGSKYAVATVNGTSALHIALIVAGVKREDEVITQPLTFIATCNAISYIGASPVFIDVDKETLGMSPESLEEFLQINTEIRNDGFTYNKKTNRKISACVPMHTFGHPVRIDRIVDLCKKYNIILVEDSAESLGSFSQNKHTGTFGHLGVFSFNGNKVVTTGGGGMIVTNDEKAARLAKHLTTTARIPHEYEIAHDMIGYNYRLPNLNAALGCAQLENLNKLVNAKRVLAEQYKTFFKEIGISFFSEPEGTKSNYWLNAIILSDLNERDNFLKLSNKSGTMTRPVWRLMNELSMFSGFETFNLSNSYWFEARLVNIPSTPLIQVL